MELNIRSNPWKRHQDRRPLTEQYTSGIRDQPVITEETSWMRTQACSRNWVTWNFHWPTRPYLTVKELRRPLILEKVVVIKLLFAHLSDPLRTVQIFPDTHFAIAGNALLYNKNNEAGTRMLLSIVEAKNNQDHPEENQKTIWSPGLTLWHLHHLKALTYKNSAS